ncbi:MAG: sensor domain-containing diguanylate cyclase [Candidatus Omnitrophica bacterium]|nr:sensor domain-containing diguanylate cyclase [Candidatus Omnitrophota bacterium]
MGKNKSLSLASQGLRYKLRISFYLMSILPILILIHIVLNYIPPDVGLKLGVVAYIVISIFIASAGFFVIKEVLERILSLSTDAKLIAAGDINHKVITETEDELGDLAEALNQLTQRIRNNMDELKGYSEKTTKINLEIQKMVPVLYSLLQISSLLSQGAKLEDTLKIITEKARLLASSDVAYLLLREEGKEDFGVYAADGVNSHYLFRLKITPQESNLLEKIIKTTTLLILDKENIMPKDLALIFYEKFKLRNTLALGIYLRGRLTGILGIGNNKEQFLYQKDDIEFLDLFAKQITIALENNFLIHRVEKLEIKDALTGLYNESFIISRLQEEIERAIIYQRPCAFILLDVDNFGKFHQQFGSLQAEEILKRIARLIKNSVTEVDRVGRTGNNEFAIVLPEKNKRQAQEIAEAIRKKIEFSFSEEEDLHRRLTVSGGVSENPLDGIEAKELISKAKELLILAKKQGRNRIVFS